MLTKEELRRTAWSKQLAAKALVKHKMWGDAAYTCGYAVELMLKARICVDRKLAGFPESRPEFKHLKTTKGLDLQTHDFECLLNMTTLASHVKQGCLKEWGACLQWGPAMRYQPMGTITEVSATELIRSAVVIIRRIAEIPGLQGYDAALQESDNPYVKLVPVEHELSDEHGKFSLFCVFHRMNSFPMSSDIVVSAPWIDANSREGVEFVTDAIQRVMVGDQINAIAAVIALDRQHPVVVQLTHTVGAEHSIMTEFINCKFGDVDIEHAMIITCQRD